MDLHKTIADLDMRCRAVRSRNVTLAAFVNSQLRQARDCMARADATTNQVASKDLLTVAKSHLDEARARLVILERKGLG